MTIIDIIVSILAIVGIYHIIEDILFINFEKKNRQFLNDFKNEYQKRNNDKTIQ